MKRFKPPTVPTESASSQDRSIFDRMTPEQRQKLCESLKRLGQKMNMPPNRKIH